MSRSVDVALLLLLRLLLISQTDADITPHEGSVGDNLKALFIGDWGFQFFGIYRAQQRVAEAMSVWADANHPAWIQTVGDNIYPAGIHSWNDHQVDSKWRDIYKQPSLKDLVWHMALGNHDYGVLRSEEWNQVELSKHEQRWYQPWLWYDYVEDVGDHSVHFVVIDTEAYNDLMNNFTLMVAWLDDTLKASTADWKIVVGHRTAYSAGLHGPTASAHNLLPIMERHKVDVYICGHDHNLQHLRHVDGDGLDFIVCGGGGAPLYGYNSAHAQELKQRYGIETKFFQSTHGFVSLTSTKTQLKFDFYDEHNKNIYSVIRDRQQGKRLQFLPST